MNYLISIQDAKEQIAFAERAAKSFAKHKEYYTYSDSDITPGCFLAIRWGLLENCVLVVKVDKEHIPTNYRGLIQEMEEKQ